MRWAGDFPHYVYECRDDGKLLYIGCTGNPENRLKGLQRNDWWTETTRATVTHAFANRREAYQFENARIRQERPPMNLQGNPARRGLDEVA